MGKMQRNILIIYISIFPFHVFLIRGVAVSRSKEESQTLACDWHHHCCSRCRCCRWAALLYVSNHIKLSYQTKGDVFAICKEAPH